MLVSAEAQKQSQSAPFLRLSELRKLRKCEQVAAVCYRMSGAEIEFLLIQTRGRGRWTFPKGGTEPGLTHAQVAALEAFEEAGVHGRIEEAAFITYVRSGSRRRSGADRKEPAVNAHLCEVLRLVPPQESNRQRTWFSAAEAKLRLGEGRSPSLGAEFARVIDAAVARIRPVRRADGVVELTGNRRRNGQQWASPQKDALQKVQFEIPADAFDRPSYASAMPYSGQQGDEIREFAARAYSPRRKVLPCEIVEFDSSREFHTPSRPYHGTNAKALGTGMKKG
jgi:8-oxo-dGTP pyrophosphatase MutT (NUDIX family)